MTENRPGATPARDVRGTLGAKLREHVTGAIRLGDAQPHALAAALGLLSLAWGATVYFVPSTWEATTFYANLASTVPSSLAGAPMILSGAVQLVGATNGVMLSRAAQCAIVVQACVWGAVSWSAVTHHPASTGAAVYCVLACLSVLLFWQWRGAARRAGKLPPV